MDARREVDLAAWVDEQCQAHRLAGMDPQHAGGVDVRMLDGDGRAGRRRVDVEGAAAPPARESVGGHHFVDDVEVAVRERV